MYVFRWSFKNHLNYKNSTSPSQIQYQINNSTPFIPIPDNLTVNMLMKPTYDDGMTEKLPVQFLMWYLRISNELLLLHPLLIGVWRSWLAHMSGGHGVGSSSLLTPTTVQRNQHIYCWLRFSLVQFAPHMHHHKAACLRI